MVILCNIWPGKKSIWNAFLWIARYLVWQNKSLKTEIQLCCLSFSVAIYVSGTEQGLDASCIAFSVLHPSSSAEMLHLCSRAHQSDAEDVHSWALWFPDRKSGMILEIPTPSCQPSFLSLQVWKVKGPQIHQHKKRQTQNESCSSLMLSRRRRAAIPCLSTAASPCPMPSVLPGRIFSAESLPHNWGGLKEWISKAKL